MRLMYVSLYSRCRSIRFSLNTTEKKANIFLITLAFDLGPLPAPWGSTGS